MTNEKMDAIKMPWKFVYNLNFFRYDIRDSENKLILYVKDKKTAEAIVQAINGYDALVEALKKIKKIGYCYCDTEQQPFLSCSFCIAIQALSNHKDNSDENN